MATTIGIKLFYGTGVDAAPDNPSADTIKTAATTQLYGVQNIPELQTAPSAIDVTSLEDYEEQAEPGLISGSSLGITINYKPGAGEATSADKSNFEDMMALSSTDKTYPWMITLPNGRYFAFYAKARVTIGAMSVATALQFTLTLFKSSRVFTGYTAPATPAALSSDVIG